MSFIIMKRVIGFGLIFTGLGIVIGNLIESGCICILLTASLIGLGIKLFCCDA